MGLRVLIRRLLHPNDRCNELTKLFEPFTPDGCQYEVHPCGIFVPDAGYISVELKEGRSVMFQSSGREMIPVLTKYHPSQ